MISLAYLGGWLLLGLVLCRIAHHLGFYEEFRDDTREAVFITVAIVFLAPILAPLALAATTVGGAGYGIYRLVTLPTRAERRARRKASLEEERERVRADARRLGLPMVEADDA